MHSTVFCYGIYESFPHWISKFTMFKEREMWWLALTCQD
uniref:Uncharacterized protein n=1 Tax=Anguilla anguilla TaxID=7936 RepID=A0A0E9XYM2_ANGAN